jgi:cleavage and polyadenylation specificity factor subunit 1
MQSYTQLIKATAVTHSLFLPFLSSSSSELVVAKTDLIQIFALKTISEDLSAAKRKPTSRTNGNTNGFDRRVLGNGAELGEGLLDPDIQLQRVDNASSTKLVLVAEFLLAGSVTGIARVKANGTKSGGDRLLVSLKSTKLSLLEWDPERAALSTISIHFYESENIQTPAWSPDLSQSPTYLTVDPSSRCAALKFGLRSLAILPFKQSADEDLVLDDYDIDIDGEHPKTGAATSNRDMESLAAAPYASSFVLPLTLLDPSLTNPIHITFLHQYREPTFGILFSSVAPSLSLLPERKDIVSYVVFTLDLEQKASTTILSISHLPYDLNKIVPLPLPVGGALLLGYNEIIHIDQSGRTNGVAVNEFAAQCTSFGLADQSSLELKLEGCIVEQLGTDSRDVLLILQDGRLAIVGFNLDGRSVSGINIRMVANEDGGGSIPNGACCISVLSKSTAFIGSEYGDGVILGWRLTGLKKKKVSTKDIDEDILFDEDEDEEDEDDIYGESTNKTSGRAKANTEVDSYKFRVTESLINLAPLKDVAFGRPYADNTKSMTQVFTGLEMVAIYGQGKSSGVAIMKKAIEPLILAEFKFPEADNLWPISPRKPNVVPGPNQDIETTLDTHMIVSIRSGAATKQETCGVYTLTANGYQELKGSEFDGAAGSTVSVGLMGDSSRVIQVLKSEVRSYDSGESQYSSSILTIRCYLHSCDLSNYYGTEANFGNVNQPRRCFILMHSCSDMGWIFNSIHEASIQSSGCHCSAGLGISPSISTSMGRLNTNTIVTPTVPQTYCHVNTIY